MPPHRPWSLLVPVLAAVLVLPGCISLDDIEGMVQGMSGQSEKRELDPTGVVAGKSTVAILTLGVVETRRSSYGLVTPASVSVTVGDGDIRIRSPYGVATDTRQSVIDAARAAAFVAGVKADAFDYVVTLDEDAGPMSGPSAGSQFALGFYVALNNLLEPADPLDVADAYAGTGTIAPQGSIGEVGGIPDKLEAAAEDDASLFAYPDGPVYTNSGYAAKSVDLKPACSALHVRCVKVGTLAELIDLATVPA